MLLSSFKYNIKSAILPFMFFKLVTLCVVLFAPLVAVSPEVLETVRPYLLPEKHPAKKVLDQLLAGQPLKDETAFRKAGFQFKPRTDPRRQMVCGKHPRLKGFLIKTYFDIHANIGKEELNWIQRIKGAEQLRQEIAQHKYSHIMKVPKKWIYLLPDNPSLPRRRFVLVVEDMVILKRDANLEAYYFQMSRERLTALYTLLTENLLIDSIYIDNIPFCKDGKIAFIDTEHYNVTHLPLRLHFLTSRLCPPMAKHWQELIPNFKQTIIQ